MRKPLREIAALLARGDEAMAAKLLEQLLTPAELEALAQRWEIVRLLHAGVSQREIARRLGVSLCNITRGSRELKRKRGAFRTVLEGGRR